MTDRLTILQGDALERLRELPDGSAQMCVTSPPYWGLRNYGIDGQMGLEPTPEAYVEKMTVLFREVGRVMKDDGTLWLNLGDSYTGGNPGHSNSEQRRKKDGFGLKSKDLIGIPWMVAFALRADGWFLRCDIIWAKPNPMPESVTDRPTRAHEYLFLLSKSAKYFYDHEAIKEPPSPDLIKQIEEGYNGQAVKDYLGASVQDASATKGRIINGYRNRIDKQRGHGRRHAGFNDKWDALTSAEQAVCGRNKRSVWTVPPANFKESHFATFPPDLIKPCIKAGSRPGDTVIDPFFGSGTTGLVALELGRKCIGIDLNPDYIEIARRRCNVTPGLAL